MKMNESLNIEAMLASRLGLTSPKRKVAEISLDDIKLHGNLGSGAFSCVSVVSLKNPSRQLITSPFSGENDEATSSISSDLTEDSFLMNSQRTSSISSSLDSSDKTDPRSIMTKKFALKRLKADVRTSRDARKIAVEDLLLEVEVLTRVPSHPNIIKLAAVCNGLRESPEEGFVLLEKLEETLQSRLGRWETQARSQRKLSGIKVWNFGARRSHNIQEERHRVACCAVGIASALEHLHKHKIVYRDCKPANIGFASHGCVRLFDFGMSRSCDSEDVLQKRLTGAAGTPRYMSPEVALHRNYGLSADVYSFAMVLWQISTLKKPYGTCSDLEEWFKAAVKLQKRPSLRGVADPRIGELIQACWDHDPEARPTFTLVTRQLQLIVSNYQHYLI